MSAFYAVTTRVTVSARVQETCGCLLAVRDRFLYHVRLATAKWEGRAGQLEISAMIARARKRVGAPALVSQAFVANENVGFGCCFAAVGAAACV